MIRIELRLFGHLRDYLPKGGSFPSTDMEVEDGLTLGELLDKLGIPDSEPKILFVNGIHAQRSQTLKDGDRVSVFPPVAGG